LNGEATSDANELSAHRLTGDSEGQAEQNLAVSQTQLFPESLSTLNKLDPGVDIARVAVMTAGDAIHMA
jgi:hypothetical protein